MSFKNWVIVVAASSVAVSGAYMIFNQGRSSRLNRPAVDTASPSPTPFSTVSPLLQTSPGTITSPEVVRKEREKRLNEVATAAINLFGKVVDQNGNPISGAKIRYIVGSLDFRGSPTVEGPVSDENGRFSILGQHGPDLSVFVEHPDYYTTDLSSRRFEYSSSAHADSSLLTRLSDAEEPAVFVLRQKGQAEALIHHQRIDVRLPMNGTPVTIDLNGGKIGHSQETLRISLVSAAETLPTNAFYPFNWSVTIEAPGGMLIERGENFAFEAPNANYQTQLVVNMPVTAEKQNWKSRIERDFFVHFANDIYARVRLTVSAEKGSCRLEAYLNPKPGSRNLEYDPDKTVNR